MTWPPQILAAVHAGEGAVGGSVVVAIVHLVRLIIRRMAARAQSCIIEATPAAPTLSEENQIMASGSWANRFIFGPIAALFAGAATSTDPQVKTAMGAVQLAISTDLQAVNPLFDLAVTDVEKSLDTLLQGLGPLGYIADGALVHPAVQLGANALKQLIDHKLGIAVLPGPQG